MNSNFFIFKLCPINNQTNNLELKTKMKVVILAKKPIKKVKNNQNSYYK